MSTEVDSRIVEMKFDSKDFEKNAQSTLTLLDKLKAKLNFDDTKDKMSSFDTSKIQKELSKINDFDTSKIESVFDKLEYRMSNMGIFTARIVENIADDIYNMVKKAMEGVEKVVTFAEQGIVQGGYNRAANIESAKFQLEGLGIKWAEIYGDIDYAVTNTAYSLDQAAIVASQLASSGIKPGTTWKDATGKERDIDEMAMILRTISGTASATGGNAGYADIGRIFTKMISYGKVYTSQLNELGTYGIGAKGIVAEYLSSIGYKGQKEWTEQDVANIMSDRKGGGLDPYLVMEAFFEKFSEHATAANETLTGVTANLRAALARIGERFFAPIIANGGPLVKFLDNLRKSINDLNKAIGPTVESMGKMVAGWIETFANGDLFYETVTNPETGEKERQFKLGGIFSDFLKPWKEGEWLENDYSGMDKDKIPTTIPKEYYQEYETRAQKIAANIRDIVKNMAGIITGVGKMLGSAFKGASDGGFSLAAILVKITGLLSKVTGTIGDFVNGPEFVNSGVYLFFRFLADSVRILISFGKSVATHLIKPIFNAGKTAAEASGIGSWFRDLFDRIHNFSVMLQQDGNEDYFGPFLERVKASAIAVKEKLSDVFGGIISTVKDGMISLVDWWRPVKDIIFDTDLGFKDKIRAIKSYFTENFELPGWSKIKDIFGGIADAVGKAFDAIKKFFGFGKKDKSQGFVSPGEGYLAGNIKTSDIDLAGTLSKLGNGVEETEKKTSLLGSIASHIADFFGSIKESFASVDLDGIKGVSFGILAVLAILAIGIVVVVKKLISGMKKVVIDFPKLASKLVESFNDVLVQIGGMFKAQKVEAYTAALKNIAVATGMLGAIFLGMAAILAIIDHFGGGEQMAEGMHTAGKVITQIAVELTLLLAALMAISNIGAVAGSVSIGKKGLNATLPGQSLNALAAVISSFVKGIIALTAVVIVLGALSYAGNLIRRGMDAMFEIAIGLTGLVLILMSLSALYTVISSMSGGATAFAGSLAAIAGIVTSFVVGIVLLTPALVILGALSWTGLLDRGLDAMFNIMGWLTIMIAALMGVTALITKAGKLNASQTTAAILSMTAMIAVITGGILSISIAMLIVGKLNGEQFAKSIFAFILMSSLLVGLPAALLYVYKKLSLVESTKFSNNPLTSMAIFVTAIGVAVLIMSKGLKDASSADPGGMVLAIVGIAGIFAVMAAVVYNLARLKTQDMINAAILIGVMGGVMIAINTMLIILSKNLNMSMIGAGIIMVGELALLAVAVLGLSKFLNRFGEGTIETKDLANFAEAMLLISTALLPISAAMFVIIAALGTFNGVGWDKLLAASAGMVGVMVALVMMITYMTNHLKGDNVSNLKQVVVLVLTVSAMTAVVAAALSGVFIALGQSDLTGGEAFIIAVAFAGIIAAFGFAIKSIVNSVAGIKNVKGSIGILLTTLATIIVPIGVLAAAIALLSTLPVHRIIASSVAIAALSVGAFALTKFLINFARREYVPDNKIKTITAVLATYAVVCASSLILAKAIIMLSAISGTQMRNGVITLSVMGAAIAGITYILGIIGNKTTDYRTALTAMGSFAGVTVSLYVIALALKKLSEFKFEDIKSNLVALGGIAVIALGIAVLFGLFENLAAGALSAAALLLSVGATMAAVGVMLWLSAEALDKFIDVLLKIDGKTETITNSLTGLLNAFGSAIKSVFVGIAGFINDPEVRQAFQDAIMGLLSFIDENVVSWIEKILDIGTKIIKAIVDHIDLYAIGEFIDQKLLGGAITTSIDVIVETNMNIKKMELLSGLYSEYRGAFTDVARVMGYTEEQFTELESKRGDKLKGYMDYLIDAYNFGNEAYKKQVEDAGGMGAWIRKLLEHNFEELNIVPNTNTVYSSIKKKVNDTIESVFPVAGEDSEMQIRANLAAGLLRQAWEAGWTGTDEGNRLINLVANEIQEMIDHTDDDNIKFMLREAAKRLGIELPEGAEEGINSKDPGLSSMFNSIEMELGIHYTTDGKKYFDYGQHLHNSVNDGWNSVGSNLLGFDTPLTVGFRLSKENNSEAEKAFTSSAPYKSDYNLTKSASGYSMMNFRDTSKEYEDIDELNRYKTDIVNWIKTNYGTSKDLFAAIGNGDLGTVKNTLGSIVTELKETGATYDDIKNMFGKNVADLFAGYASTIGLGGAEVGSKLSGLYKSLVGVSEQGQSNLNKTLGGGAGGAVNPQMAFNRLSADYTKNFFNPLNIGLQTGFMTAGNSGVSAFTTSMGTTGEVLAANRPYIEALVSAGFLDPLGLFLQAGGTADANMYRNSMINVFNTGFTARPKVTLSPEITMAVNTFSSGLSLGAGMSNPITQYINSSLGLEDVYSSPFRYSGEMITAGLMYGMQDAQSRRTVKDNTSKLAMTVVNYIRQAFRISSPAHMPELVWASEMITAGVATNLTNSNSENYIKEGANDLANDTGSAITDSMSNIDFTSMSDNLSKGIGSALDTSSFDNIDIAGAGSKLKEAFTSNLPSWESIKSNFGWEKGITGNLEGIKNVWHSLKDAFGNFNVQDALKAAGIDISSFTSGMNFSNLSLESIGFSLSADSGFGNFDFSNEFGGFDINDFATNTDLGITLDLDTTMADDWLKQNTSMDIAASIPVTGGYERSTTGSTTYVNNYSFNQSNTSPQALSARDTARLAENMLMRAKGWNVAR